MELGNRDRMQDDDRSSVSSFAVVGDHHYGNDAGNESDTTELGNGEFYKERHRHLKEGSSNTSPPSSLVLFQVGKWEVPLPPRKNLLRLFRQERQESPPVFL